MFITDPLLAELGVPTNANPNPCSKLSGGLRYVVTDQAILYLEDSRTNLALDKGTKLTVLENCRINLRVATPNGDIGWVLQQHVSAEPIEAKPPNPADETL